MEMISVIIPLYNKEKAIGQTLESVLNQTYSNFEVIVCDDGSTDGSAAIVKSIAEQEPRVNYYYKANAGVSSARNFGLLQAKGNWVIFLDADDEMLPNNLQVLMNLVSKYKVLLSAANVCVKHSDGKLENIDIRLKGEKVFSNFIVAILKHQAIFASGACLYNRNLLGSKPYDEKLSRYEDAEFELHLFVKASVAMTSEITFVHHAEFARLSKISNNSKEMDYIFNMDFCGKTFWQKVKMGQYINEGSFTYFSGAKDLKALYRLNYFWRYVYIFLKKVFGVEYRIKKCLKICGML